LSLLPTAPLVLDLIRDALAAVTGLASTDTIRSLGYAGVGAIVFAESGLLVGIMLPGDSLLFTAGFLASQGVFSLPVLALVCVAAAIAGDGVGYSFGRRVGRRLFERPDSRFFKRRHLLAAEAFYERHGGKTIVLARFLPVVRTLAPIVAGVANMHYPRFALFNAAGGLLWGAGVTTAGYLLGSTIPDPDRYLIPVVLVIIVISALPSALHVLHANRHELAARLRPGRTRGGRRPRPRSEPVLADGERADGER
jgi:membrane-associated protein